MKSHSLHTGHRTYYLSKFMFGWATYNWIEKEIAEMFSWNQNNNTKQYWVLSLKNVIYISRYFLVSKRKNPKSTYLERRSNLLSAYNSGTYS